jgi:hypothetical protein
MPIVLMGTKCDLRGENAPDADVLDYYEGVGMVKLTRAAAFVECSIYDRNSTGMVRGLLIWVGTFIASMRTRHLS